MQSNASKYYVLLYTVYSTHGVKKNIILSQISENQIIKLYFHNNASLSIKEDISSLTHQVQSHTYSEEWRNKIFFNYKKKRKRTTD